MDKRHAELSHLLPNAIIVCLYVRPDRHDHMRATSSCRSPHFRSCRTEGTEVWNSVRRNRLPARRGIGQKGRSRGLYPNFSEESGVSAIELNRRCAAGVRAGTIQPGTGEKFLTRSRSVWQRFLGSEAGPSRHRHVLRCRRGRSRVHTSPDRVFGAPGRQPASGHAPVAGCWSKRDLPGGHDQRRSPHGAVPPARRNASLRRAGCESRDPGCARGDEPLPQNGNRPARGAPGGFPSSEPRRDQGLVSVKLYEPLPL